VLGSDRGKGWPGACCGSETRRRFLLDCFLLVRCFVLQLLAIDEEMGYSNFNSSSSGYFSMKKGHKTALLYGEMIMKKYLLILTFGVLASFMVTGCLGTLEQQADRNKQNVAEAKFKTYSQLAGAENGVITIKVKNKLSTTVLLRMTIAEEKDAWKVFEIPGDETVPIEVGATDYLLQAQHGSDGSAEPGSSNELLVSASNITVEISGAFDQFGIFIP